MLHFHQLIDPRHLLHSDAKIRSCQRDVEAAQTANNWKELQDQGVSKEQIIKKNVIVKACVHPTTNEIIVTPGRMAGFVPFNIPITAGMCLATPTLPNLIFWQWMNQTYNAMFNYCNAAKGASPSPSERSSKTKTKPWEGMEDLIKGYSAAVTVSVGLSVGLNVWLKRAKLAANVKNILQAVIPYTAVASAGVSNVAFMRLSELKTGIPVFSDQGELMGNSKVAARYALKQTAVTRAVLPIPIVAFPVPCLALLYRIPLFTSSALMKAVAQVSVVTLGVWVGLPAAVALFPQYAELPISQLEEEFRSFANADGSKSKIARFNKGV